MEYLKINLLISSFIIIRILLKSLLFKLRNKLKFIEVKKIKINFKQTIISLIVFIVLSNF
ncbi:hypothetical protein SAMN02787100_3785 [Chryseobacterium sp. OV279]|nr:hypothetical protein SAMN02787100_3785 [Chryseobacterium sp. OV279]